jgi:effector-binding domain-containing protein
MLKIGDFAKLTRLSVQTLRYYDDLGLLKPVEVDRFTGYRYYAYDQLPRLHRILALKDLGLSLEQIARLLAEDLPPAELRGMLRLKWSELREHVEDELAKLERVEARLRQIEQENSMSNYDVVIKKVDPILVAGVRDIIPAYPQQGHLWNELETYLDQQNAARTGGACLTIYHADEPQIDAEVCEPLGKAAPAAGRVQVHELPGLELAASAIHHGPFTTIPEAYQAIVKWIDVNGYRCIGPVREVYLQPPQQPSSQTDPTTVTEIQFPVEKV